jgi:hypothetical protein
MKIIKMDINIAGMVTVGNLQTAMDSIKADLFHKPAIQTMPFIEDAASTGGYQSL